MNKATLYFAPDGFLLFDNDRAMALKKFCRPKSSPEDELRGAWYALGKGLEELISDGFEFAILLSPTKVIDQLEGSPIDDVVVLKMKKEIVEKAFTKLLHVEKRKISYDEYGDHRARAENELGG